MIDVEFKGFEQLAQKFSELSEMDRMKFFAAEFKPVGRMIERAMKSQTPVYQGEYWKSKQYASRNHQRGTLRESIGMKMGGGDIPVVWISLNRKASRDAWYSHMVLGGHKYKSVSVRPNPIVTRTWESIGTMVESQLENRFKNKLTALLK